MEYNLRTIENKEEYMIFLEFLKKYCNKVKIIETEEVCDFINEIEPFLTNHIWTRRFPGYGREGNMKVLVFPLNENIIVAFAQYNSFLEIGCNEDNDEGLDMAFYKEDELVFHVLNHENMLYLEDKYVSLYNLFLKER